MYKTTFQQAKQNYSVLTSKFTTATITTGLQTRLQCNPQIIFASIAYQKKDMLQVKKNKDQKLKKFCVVGHAMW